MDVKDLKFTACQLMYTFNCCHSLHVLRISCFSCVFVQYLKMAGGAVKAIFKYVWSHIVYMYLFLQSKTIAVYIYRLYHTTCSLLVLVPYRCSNLFSAVQLYFMYV